MLFHPQWQFYADGHSFWRAMRDWGDGDLTALFVVFNGQHNHTRPVFAPLFLPRLMFIPP